MKFIIADTYEEMSRIAADIIADQIRQKPTCGLGLATGTTPIGLYKCLVEDHQQGLSFAGVKSFNLDEYRGLNPSHNQSYRYFMDTNLFNHVDINVKNVHIPDGANPDDAYVAKEYEQIIANNGGVDLQLLGLGNNGHIGFNEPDDTFPQRTHLVQLTQSTIEANSRLFDNIDDVPREAYTMGVGTIMAAAKVLVVANGKGKAQIVHDAFFGPVTPRVPASVLQFHRDATVVVDAEAGSYIKDLI